MHGSPGLAGELGRGTDNRGKIGFMLMTGESAGDAREDAGLWSPACFKSAHSGELLVEASSGEPQVLSLSGAASSAPAVATESSGALCPLLLELATTAARLPDVGHGSRLPS